MKKYLIPLYMMLAAILSLSACQHNTAGPDAGPDEGPMPVIEKELNLSGLGEDHWTYFCFATGETVGTSAFLSEEEDELWSKREDWDFAVCGNYLKTNSGTSGIGAGGVLRDETHNFLTLDEAPEEGYLQDEVMVTR